MLICVQNPSFFIQEQLYCSSKLLITFGYCGDAIKSRILSGNLLNLVILNHGFVAQHMATGHRCLLRDVISEQNFSSQKMQFMFLTTLTVTSSAYNDTTNNSYNNSVCSAPSLNIKLPNPSPLILHPSSLIPHLSAKIPS